MSVSPRGHVLFLTVVIEGPMPTLDVAVADANVLAAAQRHRFLMGADALVKNAKLPGLEVPLRLQMELQVMSRWLPRLLP